MPDLVTAGAIVLKTSLLIIVAGLLALALRRQSAALRHLVWTSALALSVLMPLAVLLLPTHSILALPADVVPAPTTHEVRSGLGVWFMGSACILAWELLSLIGLARWRRHAGPLESARWAATLASFDCRVRVLESRHIASPCTWGVITPVLLLPSAGDEWPESARRSALLHELAHLQRRDALSGLISRLACVLHWYNPLIWFAAARARSLQERACDDAVLRAGTPQSDYAQFLLDVAAHMSGMPRPHSPAIGMAHSALRKRLVAILDPQAERSAPKRASVVASCAALSAITILLGMTTIAAVPEAPAPPAKVAPTLPQVPPLPTLPTLPTLQVPPVPPVPAKLPVSPAP